MAEVETVPLPGMQNLTTGDTGDTEESDWP